MKRLLLPLILGTLLFNGAACAGDHLWSQSLPAYSQGYDETRDPARDLAAATAKASAEGKKVLLLVGGEWCSWCQEMNRFLDREPDLAGQLNRTFVASFIGSPPMNLLQHAPGARPGATMGIRPEHLDIISGQGGWQMQVDNIELLGAERLVYGRVGDESLTVRIEESAPSPVRGTTIQIVPREDRMHWFDTASGKRLDA